MGTSKTVEQRLFLELGELLKKNEEKVLSGQFKVCLTTSSLAAVVSSDGDLSLPSSPPVQRSRSLLGSGRQKWEEKKRWLMEFVLKIKSLKIIHGTCTIKAPIQIGQFSCLQVLEVKKVPIHMLEGLSRLRGQLKEIIVSRSIQSLQELLEMCGGDRSSGMILWSYLKTAYLSFNNLSQLDDSLRCVPFVEVLDLSHNSLKTEGDYLKCLTDVIRCNIGFNMLTSFPTFSLANRSKLKTLVLRSNSLENLKGLEELTSLEELDAADNFMMDHCVLEVLSGLNMLQVLCLSGNPLCYHTNHRLNTATYLSPNTAGHGAFLLDGKRLSLMEIKIQKQRFYRKSLDESDSAPSTSGGMKGTGSSASLKGMGGEASNGSLLHPGNHHSKKKRGHRRIHSKERFPNIVDFEDSLIEDHSSGGASPTGSLVDEVDLSKAEDDKKRYELMREYYKDDWLKALTVERKQTGTVESLSASHAGNQAVAQVQVEVHTETTAAIAEQRMVETRSAPVCDTIDTEVDSTHVTVEDAVLHTSQANVTQETQRSPGQVSNVQSTQSPGREHVDIYSFNRGISVDVMDTSPLSPDHDQGQYGDESEPFIVMLPEADMKQLFVTVNQRFITEKDVNGDKRASLDLKCLLNFKRTDEECFGANISDGLILPILTLDFDYVQRDKRQRKYAMEDEEFTAKFASLISHHLTSKKITETLECLRCKEKFQQIESSSPTKIQQCPKCNSKMVIKAGNPVLQESAEMETSDTQAHTTTDRQTLDSAESQPVPLRRRSNAFIQGSSEVSGSVEREKKISTSLRGFLGADVEGASLQDYVDSLLSVDNENPVNRRSAVYIPQQQKAGAEEDNGAKIAGDVSRSTGTVSSGPSLHKENSWSDVRRSQQSARSSISSVDSDITILATQSKGSIATISESSHESLHSPVATLNSKSPRERSLREFEASTGDAAVSGTQWVKGDKGQLTPVGSPLSNSVCSSMVSSVYENTLSGGGDDKSSLNVDDGVLVISRDGSLTSSSTDSVTMRHSTDKSVSRSTHRYASVINSGQNVDSSVQLRNTQDGSRLGDDSSVYKTADFSQDDSTSLPNSTNVSITIDDQSVSSIYNTINSEDSDWSRDLSSKHSVRTTSDDTSGSNQDSACHSSPLRRPGSGRRTQNNRSALYLDEALGSESENSRSSDLDSFPDDLSPIKRASSRGNARKGKTSALYLNIADSDSSINSQNERGTNPQDVDEQNKSVLSQVSASSSGLPWEQESIKGEATHDRKHESLIHDEFTNIDHRLQLFLELQVFKADEVCQCSIQCSIVQYMNKDETDCLLVISTNRILIFQVTGDLDSNNVADTVHCIEDQPITELVYVDIGYGYQTLRLEFGTECSSYTLLIADEARCKQFLTLLSDIVQTAAMQDHSKLEGISKSNPVTQGNLDALLGEIVDEDEIEEEEQTLVRFILINYTDEDSDPDCPKRMTLIVTKTHVLLVNENHQWPLPRLQAPLSKEYKGEQFTLVQRQRINNIEGIEFNEFNPTELRLTFETSDGASAKRQWMIAMATNKCVKSFVDAIREPWEKDFGVSLDVTSSSFSEVE